MTSNYACHVIIFSNPSKATMKQNSEKGDFNVLGGKFSHSDPDKRCTRNFKMYAIILILSIKEILKFIISQTLSENVKCH